MLRAEHEAGPSPRERAEQIQDEESPASYTNTHNSPPDTQDVGGIEGSYNQVTL